MKTFYRGLSAIAGFGLLAISFALLASPAEANAMLPVIGAASGCGAHLAAAGLAYVGARGIVNVRADFSDPNKALAALHKAFEDFKAENDTKLRAKADVLINEKVDRINAAMSAMEQAIAEANAKIAAAALNGNGGSKLRDAEYTEAFNAHVRRGDVQASMSKGAAADGGYLTPTEWDRTIHDRLVLVSPMRRLARIQPTNRTAFSKLFNIHGTGSGWVGESDARPQTNTSQLATFTYDTGEIYANPAATQQLLDDTEFDLEAWLSGEVDREFAKQEGTAFVSGSGANGRPKGILTYVTGGANAAAHPYGAILTVNSGAATGITSDGIIDLIAALPSDYNGNASFAMNRKTTFAIRKLKDTTGNYLWQPSVAAGQPATLMGFPIEEVPDMPDLAAGSKSILFGDFQQAYLIVDRKGVVVLRDPFTAKPFVLFYTTKRVGGGLWNPDAMKALNTSV